MSKSSPATKAVRAPKATLKTVPWDTAKHLDSPETIAAYIEAALEDGDPALIVAALGNVARALGMTDLARETGLRRESLYKSLAPEGNPEFATVLRVLKAFGIRLSVAPAAGPSRRGQETALLTVAAKKPARRAATA